MTTQIRIVLERDSLSENFVIKPCKINTTVQLKLDTFMHLEKQINNKFKQSDYFVIKAEISVNPYVYYSQNYVTMSYDANVICVTDYDNNCLSIDDLQL